MRILFCINEAAPLYKLGGLGDVGSELPKALAPNCDVRLALPFHPEIKPVELNKITSFPIIFDRHELTVTVFVTFLPGTRIPVYLFSEDQYLNQIGDALDSNIAKAAVFSLSVAYFCEHFQLWQPHCLHLHDWHTALIPLFLRHLYQNYLPTVITIHNHRYTGSTPVNLLPKLGLSADACQALNWDQKDGEINLLLEGLIHADHITTVSPNYHDELLTEDSMLGSILNSKKSVFSGILNGLDYQYWNPQTDPLIHERFSEANFSAGKAANKAAIQKQLGLTLNPIPLIIYIGRVDPQQKGISLILDALNQKLLPLPQTQFVFLGTGDHHFETLLHEAAANLANVNIITRYDETLAHQLYAAADLIMIPSNYEPCGLIQLIGMRYGVLPVAHATGGLKDTITPLKTGFLYQPNDLEHLYQSLKEALNYVAADQAQPLIQAALKPKFSWQKSSQTYLKLYNQLVTG